MVKRAPKMCRAKRYLGMFTGSLETASKFDEFMYQIGLFWCVHVPPNRPRYVHVPLNRARYISQKTEYVHIPLTLN